MGRYCERACRPVGLRIFRQYKAYYVSRGDVREQFRKKKAETSGTDPEDIQ